MRGRHDHGVRRALWKKRKKRYLRRAQREQASGSLETYIDGYTGVLVHRHSPKRHTRRYTYPSPSLEDVITEPHGGPIIFGTPFAYTVAPATHFIPPHIHATPPTTTLGPHHRSHSKLAVLDYHHRSVIHRGRQTRHLTGRQRASWAAFLFWKKHGGFFGGVWPSWDPDHRTPFIDDG